MSTTNAATTTRCELATRVNGGLEITLFWHPRDNSTSVEIHQALTGDTISVRVPSDRALDAFHHPFAHLEDRPEPTLTWSMNPVRNPR